MTTLGLRDLGFVGGLGGYDADAQTYISIVEAVDGQSLETAVKDAINAFVVGCKTDGIWSAIKASCILAGARTLAGALVPLVGTTPTNVNFVSGDYNRKTGLVGNGSSKYLNSNRGNNADPQDNCHLSVYASSLDTSNTATVPTFYMGAVNAASNQGTSSLGRFQSKSYARLKDANLNQVDEAVGLLGGSRSSSSSRITRSNKVSTTAAISSNSPNTGNIFVFARNIDGAPELYSNARLAFYSIGEALDLALLDARVTTLIDAIAAAIP